MSEPVVRETLLVQSIPLHATASVEVRRITMLPGVEGGAHRHNGPVFGAIERGSVVFQIAGGDPRTLSAGDVFHEPARDTIARWDATEEGATFLGYFLLERGRTPELTPLSRSDRATDAPVPVPIRPAVIEDADGIWPLARDFAASFVPARADFDRTLPALLTRDDTALLVAVAEDHVIVGYLLASTHLTFLANGPVAWVEELMVREDRRRQGVGARLMSAAEEWAALRGAAYVSLASRRAEPFYRALGYRASATYFRS